MARQYSACREVPDSKCTVAIFADREDGLIEAAVQHAVSVHGYKDSPKFRKELRKMFKQKDAAHA